MQFPKFTGTNITDRIDSVTGAFVTGSLVFFNWKELGNIVHLGEV
jgi:hypothetical protein